MLVPKINVNAVLYRFSPADLVPNNEDLPLVLMRNSLSLDPARPVRSIRESFAENGWTPFAEDPVPKLQHYRSNCHVAIGIARGSGRVLFGGPSGVIIDLRAGDAVVVPAGVAICRVAGADLLAVGAASCEVEPDLCRLDPADYHEAVERIATLPLPTQDPVHGTSGPLLAVWTLPAHEPMAEVAAARVSGM